MITDFKNSSIVNNCKSKSLQQETIYEMKKGSKLSKKKCETTWGGKKFSLETFLVNIKAYEERVEEAFAGKRRHPIKSCKVFACSSCQLLLLRSRRYFL